MSRLINIVSVLLMAASSAVSAQPIPKPLVIHFVAEENFYTPIESDCLSWQFEEHRQYEDKFGVWATDEADRHSIMFFGAPGLITVQSSIYRFDLKDLETDLKSMKGALPPGITEDYVNKSLELVARIREQDGQLSTQILSECRKMEGKSTPSFAFWKLEAVRRVNIQKYAHIAYLHARRQKGLALFDERDAIVFLTPYQYLEKDDAFVEVAGGALGDLLRRATFGNVLGVTYATDSVASSRATFPDYPRRNRTVAVVGGYSAGNQTFAYQTYVHELGHYLGLDHVFTKRSAIIDDNASCRLVTEVPDLASSQVGGSICTCLFIGSGKSRVFADYDYVFTKVNDTNLAVMNQHAEIDYEQHRKCRSSSDEYMLYFPQNDVTKNNAMTYPSKLDKKSVAPSFYFNLTTQQKKLARDMLATFK